MALFPFGRWARRESSESRFPALRDLRLPTSHKWGADEKDASPAQPSLSMCNPANHADKRGDSSVYPF